MSTELCSIYHNQVIEDVAGRRSMETLLNCYCREVASQEDLIKLGDLFIWDDCPRALRMQLGDNKILHLSLPYAQSRILALVDCASATYNFRYMSVLYFKTIERPWAPLDWKLLSGLLLEDLAQRYQRPFNNELQAQILDSIKMTSIILAASSPGVASQNNLLDFIESEQSLQFGHPFHPAPKSRQGFSLQDAQQYSPEVGAHFQLHYFAVRRTHLLQQSLLPETCDSIIEKYAPEHIHPHADFALVPVHPWQARYLLADSAVQGALRHDVLRNLGQQGNAYFPTSSIRTVFNPANPFFYKLSLHVRITNCVRKNALYELEGALQVTRIVRELLPHLSAHFPGLHIMQEPAYQSVNLNSADEEANKRVAEGFGMILRQGFNELLDDEVQPLLSGALFGNHASGQHRLMTIIRQFAALQGMPEQRAVELWFECYVSQLLPPVLYSFFVQGVIFEPHLQNVLLGLRAYRPVRIFLRDFEGVKLVPDFFPAHRLSGISARAREALWYEYEQGWNRITYCLFVNNLCEAIDKLSVGKPDLMKRLWGIVCTQLRDYQKLYGNANSELSLQTLLTAEYLPSKANLINRFFMRPDRCVSYLPLPNPLRFAADIPSCN